MAINNSTHNARLYCDGNCEFLKLKAQDKHEYPPRKNRSTSDLIVNYVVDNCINGGIFAAINCFSGGDALSGALFSLFSSSAETGLRYGISKIHKVPYKITLPNLGTILATKVSSVAIAYLILNKFGYELTNTSLVCSVIPRVMIAGAALLFTAIENVADEVAHAHHHEEPCGCVHFVPQIPRAENLLKEPISEKSKESLSNMIQRVKQAILDGKGVREAKIVLALEIDHVKSELPQPEPISAN